ncbi:MAG: hypothetical protein E6527_13915 [Mixta calida]|uniref:hypothetical protein n=1 Tax=Mixta calida TaxID=665913 RepID=UPI0011B02645|nr:hypothetical protein [Mixta calida]MDU6538695.1 hypothetical protein [Mixta calida]
MKTTGRGDNVWNVYQNLSLRRKALRTISQDGHSRIITVTRKGLKISSAPELGVSINEEYRLMVNMKNSLPPCASVALPGKEQTHALSLK